MGSTGSYRTMSRSSGSTAPTSSPSVPPVAPVNGNNPGVKSQVPNAQNTPVTSNAVNALTQMSDDQLAALIRASKGVQMPNFISDMKDPTQEFVFQAGINEKPMVLDAQAFAQFMSDNGISQGDIIARSVNGANYTNNDGTRVNLTGNQINDIIKYSRLNYIGGKKGGQALGAGAYFEVTAGKGSTGYGGTTMEAVLNPKTAKVINSWDLQTAVSSWANSHPKAARAIGSYSTGRGGTASIYALCMGYNVIADGKTGKTKGLYRGNYYNVIDRSALVIRE